MFGRSATYAPMKSWAWVVSAARAASIPIRRTPELPARISSLARSAIQPVASVSAGPPCGGLYLKPPSRGGLCEGVITMPSARVPASAAMPALWPRIEWLIAGVGVNRPAASTIVVTPLAARTSSAVTQAGSDRPCVSFPRKSGPAMPCDER